MTRNTSILLLLASTCVAQSEARKPLTLTFAGGPVLELTTASSAGSPPLSTSGSVEVGGGDARRFVVDKDDKVIFGYYIEARKDEGGFTLRIKPFDRDKIRQQSWFLQRKGVSEVPTMAAAREFPHLRPGDQVQVDILYNPTTGEKLYDVIKVANEKASAASKTPKTLTDQFSLRRPRVEANGKVLRDTWNGWMTGGALMITLAGQGNFYFGLTPCAKVRCRPASWVDRNVLRFHAGGELVEVIAKANILESSEFHTLWTYHDPQSKLHSTAIDFTCGDSVDALIGYSKTAKD